MRRYDELIRAHADLRSTVLTRLAALPRGVLGKAERTTNSSGFTVETAITGLSFSRDVLAGRRYRLQTQGHAVSTSSTFCIVRIKAGGVTLFESVYNGITGTNSLVECEGYYEPVSDETLVLTVTYQPGAGTMTFGATATRVAHLVLEDVGPA
jgi:hypothetical protein